MQVTEMVQELQTYSVYKLVVQKISRKVTETGSQKLLLNSKTVNNNHLR